MNDSQTSSTEQVGNNDNVKGEDRAESITTRGEPIDLSGLSGKGMTRKYSDEGRIASIQRPEPLGKAKVEGRMARGKNVGIESDVCDVTHLSPYNSLPASPLDGEQVIESSDDGLNEQEFPIRVPLSVAEGDVGVMDVELKRNELVKIKNITEINTESFYNSERNVSHFEAVATEEGQNTGDLNKSDNQTQNMVDAMDGHKPNTSISELLDPTYKSSVALLEELKRRRLQFDRLSGKDQMNSDLNINPLTLAENAMRGSNVLHSRTKKSLKKASRVLKAVEEHRSLPTDVSSTLSLEESKSEDSGRSTGLHAFMKNSDVSLGSSRDSKDSIDRLIEARIQKGPGLSGSGLTSLSGINTGTDSSTDKRSDESTLSSSKGVSSNMQIYKARTDLTGHTAIGIETPSVSLANNSLSDVTVPELLKLEEATEEFDSPTTIAMADKFKSQTNEISPIERQEYVIGKKSFRSSSRIKGSHPHRGLGLSDSEIVKMHRSLGAGTVTPLSWIAKNDTVDTVRSNNVSFTTLPSDAETSSSAHQEQAPSSHSTNEGSEIKTPDSYSDAHNHETKHEGDRQKMHGHLNSKEEYNDLSTGISSSRHLKESQSLNDDEGNHSEPRGIYDVRDSTGPGSTNRRRMLSGKQRIRPASRKKDPLDVYVTEDSKSEFSLLSEKSDQISSLEKRAQGREATLEELKEDSSKMQMKDSDQTYSSMSSEHPVLSYDSSHLDSMLEGPIDRTHGSVTVPTSREWNGGNVHASSSYRDEKFSHDKKHRIGTDIPNGIRLQTRYKDLNELWEKFKKTFDRDFGSVDVFKKIETMNELLNQSSISHKSKTTTAEKSPKEMRSRSSHRKTGNDSKRSLERKVSVNKEYKSRCPSCGNIDSETNGVISERSNDQPLLLHTWTQTTPLTKALKTSSEVLKSGEITRDTVRNVASGKGSFKNVESRTELAPEKENIQSEANCNDLKSVQNAKQPSSWNVVFQEGLKSSNERIVQRKPPIPKIRKEALNEPAEYEKKKKQAVFTAWFQSTRSDTSSGTVVPLSTVPKLSDAYKENKRTARMLIKEIHPRETE